VPVWLNGHPEDDARSDAPHANTNETINAYEMKQEGGRLEDNNHYRPTPEHLAL
jgi:hypothetical protein